MQQTQWVFIKIYSYKSNEFLNIPVRLKIEIQNADTCLSPTHMKKREHNFREMGDIKIDSRSFNIQGKTVILHGSLYSQFHKENKAENTQNKRILGSASLRKNLYM